MVDDAIARESDGNLVFTVRLFPPSPEEVTVSYQTQADTAIEGADENTPGADYIGVSGEFTFAPGETTKTIPVII
ncbi:MAG: Calx-beta domain-containing protein [Cyanobacteria bacterium J06638_6]